MMSFKQIMNKYFNELIYKRKLNLSVLILYTCFCLTATIILVVTHYYQNALYAVLTLLILVLLIMIEIFLKIRIPIVILILILIIPVGALLGNSFNLYTEIPWLDDFLHTISGFVFACIGFGICEMFFGKINNVKQFVGYLIIGFVFSLAIGLIWEMFEFAGTMIFNIDMQEDTIINNIYSFLLSGNHYEMIKINDITKTIIYYQNGQIFEINGYLDIGLYDTLTDMLVCLIGSVIYLVVMIIGYNKNNYKILYPKIVDKEK